MTKKKTATKAADPPRDVLTDPKGVHELLGLHGPYDPPEPPVTTKSYATFWDPGVSINELRRKRGELFPSSDWMDGQAFAKASDAWRWRLINLTPLGLGKPFEEQAALVPSGYEPPLARELIVYLVLRFLTAGELPDIRFRCRDVMPSGRRVAVGPFLEGGLEVVNVSDRWSRPRSPSARRSRRWCGRSERPHPARTAGCFPIRRGPLRC